MATVKLTKTRVDALKAGDTPAYLWDAELKGFGLRCTPGGVKAYIVQYRAGGGGRNAPKRRITIGKHGSPWTADTARAEAKRILGIVAHGGDPAAERQVARKAETISELIDLYLAEGCAHKKPLTLIADRGRFEHHIRPALGKRKVADVTRADIERLMADVIAGRTVKPNKGPRRPGSLPRGGKGVAAQVVTLVGTLLAFAANRRIRTDNPAHGIDKPKARKMERFLTSEEIARLGTALGAEEKSTGNPFPATAIRLLLLTGARRSEIIGLRWAWVDLERGALFLPDSKSGAKTIHLNAPAATVLGSLPHVEGNPFVFPGERAEQVTSGIDKVWARVRSAAKLEGVRLHDLRHSAASIGAAKGASLLLIGKVLGHRQATTTERYSHLTADPVRATAELIGSHVADALGLHGSPGTGADAEVLPLRKA
jgi:integrase